MRNRRLGLALMATAALALPAVSQAVPNGNGLYQHDTDTCVPDVGSTAMLLTGGRSMWLGDGHYVIHDYTSGDTAGFGHGAMNGIADRGTVTCSGTLEDPVTSVDYLVK